MFACITSSFAWLGGNTFSPFWLQGFSVAGQENIQEILSKQLYLCQFLCALSILRQGRYLNVWNNTSIYMFSIYTLSDLGVSSNLIGSLSLANEHYSPPTEWIMHKPNKNKMAGVNLRFARSIKSIFNGFLLKMLLRSLSVYILKQLFFSISVNSGRIFTSPLRCLVNIPPLFTEIEKKNC